LFRVKLDQYLAGCRALQTARLAILSATTIIWCNAPRTPVLMSFVQHRLRLGYAGSAFKWLVITLVARFGIDQRSGHLRPAFKETALPPAVRA
jgi:hypothetical protein